MTLKYNPATKQLEETEGQSLEEIVQKHNEALRELKEYIERSVRIAKHTEEVLSRLLK